jgi:5-methylcytosine-specific restriction endonuclease McrA
LAGSFNGAKDTLLDKLSESMKSKFDLEAVKTILRNDNRSVEFDQAKIWRITYSSTEKVYFCMSQVIPGITLSDISEKHIDHVISRDLLREVEKDGNKFKIAEIDQLANLTILDSSQNQSKGSKSLVEWLKEMDPGAKAEYLRKNCIPSDEALWEPVNFKEFIEVRKALILVHTELGRHIAQRQGATGTGVDGDDDDDGEDGEE